MSVGYAVLVVPRDPKLLGELLNFLMGLVRGK